MRNRIVRIPEDVYHDIACGLNKFSEDGIDEVILQLIVAAVKDRAYWENAKLKYLDNIVEKYGDKNKNEH